MHELVPRHVVLREEEAAKLLAKFNVSKAQLPKIKKSDPALPPEAKPGDIIKIIRGKAEYFRVVV